MNNYCNNCKIYVEDDRSHCPLCGKCVNEENLNKPRKFNLFPDYKWHKKRKNIALFIVLVSFFISLITFGSVEFFAFNSLHLSAYVLVGLTYIFIAFIMPSLKRWGFSAIAISQILLTSVLIVFIEVYSNTFGWGISYTVPAFMVASSIAVYAVMLSRGYYQRSNCYPSLCCVIISVIIFALSVTVYKGVIPFWPSLTSFVVSIVLFVSLFVFKRKKIIKGLKKDFNF